VTETPQLPTCVLCPRDRAIEQLCWHCHYHLADLLADRAGSDDLALPPGIGWLMRAVARHDGQRAVRPEPGGRAGGGFRSTSPADDTIIALRDHRSGADDHMPWLVGFRWVTSSARQLAEHHDVATARQELRALQRGLLAVLGDRAGGRLVGHCRQLVDVDGQPVSPEDAAAAWEHLDDAGWPIGTGPCDQPLWCPPQPPHGDDEPGTPPSVRCPSCRTVYGGLSLLRMGRVDVEEVAA
jgi:hypothetical protein